MIIEKAKDWLGDLAEEYLAVISKPPKTSNTEKHHILPRSLFPEYIDTSENIVKLDVLDHLKAHEILAKTNIDEMILAFWFMFTYSYRRYSDLTQEEKERLLEDKEVARTKMSKVKSAQGKRYVGDKNPFYGKTHTAEFKAANSKLHKGKKLSDEHRAAIKRAQTGTPKPKVECPHCKQMVYCHVAQRTHFDKCKLKLQ